MTSTPDLAAGALRAADVMSADVRSIQAGQSMWDAWVALLESRLRHLVVCEGPRCVGVVDDRTLFAHWPAGPFGGRATPVRDLVRARTRCVLPDATVAEVARIMLAEGTDVVPVTATDGTVVGVITGSDIVRAVAGSDRS